MSGLLVASQVVWRISRAKERASRDVDALHPVRGLLRKRFGRLRTDTRRGHSVERTVFRKCTFGAKRRLLAWRLLPPTASGSGPDLCVLAVERPEGVPSGLGRDVRPARRIPSSLAHLLSGGGGPEAAGTCLIQRVACWGVESVGSERTDGEDTL